MECVWLVCPVAVTVDVALLLSCTLLLSDMLVLVVVTLLCPLKALPLGWSERTSLCPLRCPCPWFCPPVTGSPMLVLLYAAAAQ
jgi:hypothetical protein